MCKDLPFNNDASLQNSLENLIKFSWKENKNKDKIKLAATAIGLETTLEMNMEVKEQQIVKT